MLFFEFQKGGGFDPPKPSLGAPLISNFAIHSRFELPVYPSILYVIFLDLCNDFFLGLLRTAPANLSLESHKETSYLEVDGKKRDEHVRFA